MFARAAGSGPRIVLPGKLTDDGTSSYFTGNVVASLPDGVTLPVTTSAIACPDSWPGCHASRMASGTPRQLAVSMTPPTLSTTSAFFFRAWNASVTALIKAFSSAVSSKSPSRARSRNSPELRPIVTRPRSVSFASRAISPAATAISGSGAGSMNGCVGGRFFVCSAMCAP